MLLLDGEKVAAARLKKLRRVVAKLKRPPQLAIVLAGRNEAGEVYVRQKQRVGKSVGITVSIVRDHRPTTTSLCRALARLGQDVRVDGIIVQLPLPNGVDTNRVLSALPRAKDVDGLVGPYFVPPTPAGILSLLEAYSISVAGKHTVIWGRGELVGKPLATLMVERGAWATCVHRSTRNPGRVSAQADIVIAATGVARLIRASMVKKGAVVIDAGWSRQGGKIVGDVDFIAVSKKASAITPVPGGVGPMTVVMLMENIVKAYDRRRKN
jgi:methylenetetrahydrofolate dehydrogenase (NADP+)/methenyltetrahydrofolate cyclohydrolase